MVASKGEWAKSKVSAAMLEEWATAGALPDGSTGTWRAATGDEQPRPRLGEFVMFASFVDRGLAFPSSEFFRRFQAFYGIQVHDLTPNSILHLSCFVTLCESYLG